MTPPTASALSAITLSGEPALLPASPTQVSLWLAQELAGGDDAGFVVAFACVIDGALDVARLGRALDAVITRHPMLRSRLRFADGRVVNAVHPHGAIRLDLARPSPGGSGLRSLLAAETGGSWDAMDDSLVRAGVVRVVGRDAFVLLLHHVVADSTALRTILDDLGSAYRDERRSLPPPGDHAAFVDAMQAAQTGGAHARTGTLEAWRSLLRGCPAPSTRPVPDGGSRRTVVVDHVVSPATVAAIRADATERRTTLFAAMATALILAVATIDGNEDLVVGVALSLRHEPSWERVVGLLADFAPVRLSQAATLSHAEAIDLVERQLGLAMQDPTVGFADIVEATQAAAGDARPLFSMYISGEAEGALALDLGDGLRCTPVPWHSPQLPGDVGFEIVIGRGIRLSAALAEHEDARDWATRVLLEAERRATPPRAAS